MARADEIEIIEYAYSLLKENSDWTKDLIKEYRIRESSDWTKADLRKSINSAFRNSMNIIKKIRIISQ